jgi:hypothetical protein
MERQQVLDLQDTARRVPEPHARRIRAEADGRMIEDIVRRQGVPHATAQRSVAAWRQGTLGPGIELITDHDGTILVGDVLRDPQQYIGMTLPDPHEGPDYGYGKAIIMPSEYDPGRVFIHSFAHGGRCYDMKHNLHSAEALLREASVDGLADAASLIGDRLDFSAVFKATEAADPKSAAVLATLALLRTTFLDANGETPRWFRAREIREILDKVVEARDAAKRAGAASTDLVIQQAAGFIEVIEGLTGKSDRNPTTRAIGKALVGL